MDIIKLSGAAVITAAAVSAVRAADPKLGLQAAAAGGVILLGYAAASLTGIMAALDEAVRSYGISNELSAFIFKVTGIAFTAQMASEICSDSGEQGLARKVTLCGRIAVIAAAVPQITSLMNTLKEIVTECLGS